MDHLEDLYRRYGYHAVKASYYICRDPHVINRIFDRVRNVRVMT